MNKYWCPMCERCHVAELINEGRHNKWALIGCPFFEWYYQLQEYILTNMSISHHNYEIPRKRQKTNWKIEVKDVSTGDL